MRHRKLRAPRSPLFWARNVQSLDLTAFNTLGAVEIFSPVLSDPDASTTILNNDVEVTVRRIIVNYRLSSVLTSAAGVGIVSVISWFGGIWCGPALTRAGTIPSPVVASGVDREMDWLWLRDHLNESLTVQANAWLPEVDNMGIDIRAARKLKANDSIWMSCTAGFLAVGGTPVLSHLTASLVTSVLWQRTLRR